MIDWFFWGVVVWLVIELFPWHKLEFLNKWLGKRKKKSKTTIETPTPQQSTSNPQEKTTTKRRSMNYFFTCNGCGGSFDKDLELNKNTCQACYIKDR